MTRIVVVGGVAGGMSAATRLRRLDEFAEIIVLERSGFVSYANCGLPYYLGGVIESEESLLLQTPESLHSRFKLDVRVKTEALNINRELKLVYVKDLISAEEYELPYDKLILSPGASPVVPSIPGVSRALTLRTVEDVERIYARLESKPTSAAIIGGGFIGVEIAENLVRRGVKTSIIELSDQVLPPLDIEMATVVAAELESHGVLLHLGSRPSSIDPDSVVLENGVIVEADLVLLAIGVVPDTALAEGANLLLGPRHGIQVDSFNRTNDLDIYAIGDAAEKIDALDGSSTLVPLANLANRHGRIVADHINGRDVREVATIGTAIVKVFDLTVAMTGWNEKRLKSRNRSFSVIHTHPNSHAGYYPGAKQIKLKLIFDPESGEILGAQGIGTDGVDKRIDVIATAIRGGLTAPELADLELAYAPPFGSAKDPISMLGYIAENMLSGLTMTAQWSEVEKYRELGYELVDVRNASEVKQGWIPGFINIPIDEIRNRVSELSGKKILVSCQAGQRAHTASLLLNELGFRAVNLDGGYLTWSTSPAFIQSTNANDGMDREKEYV